MSFLLAAVMMLALLPATAAAAGKSYSDVKTTDWFYDGVAYVSDNNVMDGVSETAFAPSDATTRGMLVTILWRLDGKKVTGAAKFSDVPAGQYYSDAVAWAAANGIVSGYDNGTFGANDFVSREQLAAILYRYANYKGYNTAARADLTKFNDSGIIGGYAYAAFSWANSTGLISGVSNKLLDPQGAATRAQIAVILMRFCKGNAVGKTYTVTFSLNYTGKGVYEKQTVNAGAKAVAPKDPTRSGCTFLGWYTKEIGGSKYDFKRAVNANLKLYAHWGTSAQYVPSSSSSLYTVTFDLQGHGSPIAAQQITKGGKVTKPADPVANNCTFLGWFKNKNAVTGELSGEWDFDNDTVSTPVTLYAKWEEAMTQVGFYVYDDETYAAINGATAKFITVDHRTFTGTTAGYGYAQVSVPRNLEGHWEITESNYIPFVSEAKTYTTEMDLSGYFYLIPKCTLTLYVDGINAGNFVDADKNVIEKIDAAKGQFYKIEGDTLFLADDSIGGNAQQYHFLASDGYRFTDLAPVTDHYTKITSPFTVTANVRKIATATFHVGTLKEISGGAAINGMSYPWTANSTFSASRVFDTDYVTCDDMIADFISHCGEITYEGYEIKAWTRRNGTYEFYPVWEKKAAPKTTIADVLKTVEGFPNFVSGSFDAPANAWVRSGGAKCYTTDSGYLRFDLSSEYKTCYFALTGECTQSSDNFVFEDANATLTFTMYMGKLRSITFTAKTVDYSTLNGIYQPAN